MVKRTSYSFVSSKPAAAKRPLGVRGLSPTRNAESSLNSQNTYSNINPSSSSLEEEKDDVAGKCGREGVIGPPVETGTGTGSNHNSTLEQLDEKPSAGENASSDVEDCVIADGPFSSRGCSGGHVDEAGECERTAEETEKLPTCASPSPANFVRSSTASTTQDTAAPKDGTAVPKCDLPPSPPRSNLLPVDDLPPQGHKFSPSHELLDEQEEAEEDSEIPLPDSYSGAGANEESFGQDDDEDFRVLSDRGIGPRHRKARVSGSSIDGTLLVFNDRYDSPDVDRLLQEAPVVAETESLNNTEEAGNDKADAAAATDVTEEAEPEIPYSYPPSGKNVAFI